MNSFKCLLICGLCLTFPDRCTAQTPAASATAIKAGAYYFDGWTGKTEHIHLSERLRGEFGYRKPIWGWVTSTPDVMRAQIDCAADYGLGFFAFCWYYPEGANKETPVNNALQLFLAAPNQQRMEFCLLVANHGGFRIGPADWEECCQRWVKLFQHPSYVKANGEPLLIIFSPDELNTSFGGPQAVRAALDGLRAKARRAGLPGVAVAGCWTSRDLDTRSTLPNSEVESGYSFVTGYAMPHDCAWDWPRRPQPYQHLLDGHVRAWDLLASHSPLPYIPVATIGWDMRPWEKPDLPDDKQVIWYPHPTPQGIETMLRNGVSWLREHPDRTAHEKLLLIYAWNEYGEGGFLTPTERDGYSFLEAVKRGLK
jgi:hypothetical protein